MYPWKIWVTQVSTQKTNRRRGVSIAKDPDPNNWVKRQETYFFGVLQQLVIYLSGFDLFNMFYFS